MLNLQFLDAKKLLPGLISVLTTTVVLMLPSLYNGFPLVYSDTGMYIKSGMELFVPVDRPIVYGLFIRALSSLGLWGIVITQNLILSLLLHSSGKKLLSSINSWLPIIAIFISSFTAVGWYSGQLMPDIFAAYIPLCIFLIVYKSSIYNTILGCIVLLASLLTHYSHILIAIAWLLLFILLIVLNGTLKKQMISVITLGSIILIASLSLSLINYRLDQNFGWSKGSSVFLMGKLLDTGLLDQYLKENCNMNDLSWCNFRDRIPADSRELLWSAESPLNDLGGWEASKEANMQVINGLLRSPQYWPKLILIAIQSTLSQLTQNDIGSGLDTDWYSKESSPPFQYITKYFPNQLPPYLQSRQNDNLWDQGLNFKFLNNINLVLMSCSWMIILLSCWRRFASFLTPDNIRLRNIVLSFVVVNAFVTATFANVYDRLQSRVSWLIILVAIFLLYNWLKYFYNVLKQSSSASQSL